MKAQFNFPREVVTESGRHEFPQGIHEVPDDVAEHPYFASLVKVGDAILFEEAKVKTTPKKTTVAKQTKVDEDETKEDFKLPTDYNELLKLAKEKGLAANAKPTKVDVIKFLEDKIAEEAKDVETETDVETTADLA